MTAPGRSDPAIPLYAEGRPKMKGKQIMEFLTDALVYLGAGLMVYNIYGFIRFARFIREQETQREKNALLNLPIVLLVLFLLGYLAVGILGHPDLIVSGILFGGSVFVFVMYQLLNRILQEVIKNERMNAELRVAEESSRTRSAFLASMSHEMRTPLNVILGLDDLALKDQTLREETRGHVEKIGLSARHLLGMINNVLEMNNIGAGSMTLRNEPFSPGDALEQVNAIAETLCREKGLEYRQGTIRGAARSLIGDETQLRQVLLNLLDNAVKYTDAPGTVILTAECVSEDEERQTIRFAVADTGIGMDESFLPHIFTAFEQEDGGSTTRFGGSGLSLAVTRNIVEMMGGTIRAESRKNIGSIFTVVISFRKAEKTDPEPGIRAGAEEPGSLEGRRVLIVEDLPENAEIVADLLELEGMETEHAANGRIGLDMFVNHPEQYYDAILMDLRMLVMDGLEAARRIRESGRGDARTVPVIALSANAFESDIRECIRAGMNAFLPKPTDSDKLYGTLRQLLIHSPAAEGSDKA